MSKSIQRSPESQKKDKKIYETFKGSSRVSRGRNFACETFFKVPYSKKGFVRKYETFGVSY
jgi:hypothetical protein